MKVSQVFCKRRRRLEFVIHTPPRESIGLGSIDILDMLQSKFPEVMRMADMPPFALEYFPIPSGLVWYQPGNWRGKLIKLQWNRPYHIRILAAFFTESIWIDGRRVKTHQLTKQIEKERRKYVSPEQTIQEIFE